MRSINTSTYYWQRIASYDDWLSHAQACWKDKSFRLFVHFFICVFKNNKQSIDWFLKLGEKVSWNWLKYGKKQNEAMMYWYKGIYSILQTNSIFQESEKRNNIKWEDERKLVKRRKSSELTLFLRCLIARNALRFKLFTFRFSKHQTHGIFI